MIKMYHKSIYQTLAIKNTSSKRHNYACTVKQKFASDSKMVTSLSTKARLKIQNIVLITVLLCHLYLKFQYNIKRVKEKKALKLNEHNQFNHMPEMVKSINLFIIL